MNETVEAGPVEGELRVPELTPAQGAISTPIPGLVTHQIGSGEHAQNSIVYRTILWSFVGGGLLSVASIGLAAYGGKPNPLSEIKDVWSIFIPIITLALGYLFGKGR